jgi:hypothetical protein
MVMLQIRKSLMLREVLTSDLGKSGERPITRGGAGSDWQPLCWSL